MIDLFTVNLLVSIVTMTAGVLYLVETLLRREVGAGRVWALAFLSGMLAVTAYLVWQQVSEPWIPIAIGNASLVATSGFFWLGCRSFNGRRLTVSGSVVAAAVVIQLLSTLIPGASGGEWAGSLFMFAAIAGFAALGSVESRRGAMGGMWSSFGFTIVLACVALFYAARAVVFATLGPGSPIFDLWFGSSITGVVSIVLTIVALTTATMLRSGRVTVRQDGEHANIQVSRDGVLTASSFAAVLPSVTARSLASNELLAVVSLRLDDLAQIGIAFGMSEEEAIATRWRAAVRVYSPTFALVGESDVNGMLVAFEPASEVDARRIASRIQRRVLDDLAEQGSAVIPVIGVGVALSVDVGHDAATLIAAADEAAGSSAISSDASVIVAEPVDGARGPQSVRR